MPGTGGGEPGERTDVQLLTARTRVDARASQRGLGSGS
jgi:hypothetical protein